MNTFLRFNQRKKLSGLGKRILLVIATLFSALMFPWWVTMLLLLVGIVFFHRYLEAVVIAYLGDVLFGFSTPLLGSFSLILTSCALLALLVSSLMSYRLRGRTSYYV